MENEQEDFANQSSEQESVVIDESKSLNKINLSVIAIVVVILIIGGGAYLYLNQKPETPNENIQTTENPEPIVQEEWNTYTNEEQGYSLQYPSDWFKGEEQQIMDGSNNIYSTISFNKDDRKVTITVNGNEWLLKHETDTTKEVMIDGQKYTAYIFPNGYECYGSDNPEKCSFYRIPIEKDGLWYELGATGYIDDNLEDIQFDILSTFEFFDDVLDSISEDEGRGKTEEKNEVYGFWFKQDNPAIISDFTKYISLNKAEISEEKIQELYGGTKIIEGVENGVLLELTVGGCYFGDDYVRPPLYVYTSNDTDKIFAFKLKKEDGGIDENIKNLDSYIKELLLKPEKEGVVINKVVDLIADGYYYAEIYDIDKINSKITLDFLSLRDDIDHSFNFDILLAAVDTNAGPNLNVMTTNHNKIYREFTYSNDDTLLKELKNVVYDYDNQEYKSPEFLVKIENNIITEITMVHVAC